MTSRSDTYSLRSRILRAGSWAVGGHFTSQALRLAGNLILTRLLMPEMFGVVGLAMVFLTGLVMFSDFGLRLVVIQSKRGEDETFLNTAWTMQVIRGGVLALAGIFLSGVIFLAARNGWVPADSTYAKPELPWVLGIFSLNMVIYGFGSTKTMTTSRSLNIGRTTAIDLISQVAGLACMLALAWFWPSVYVLVVGAVVSAVFSVVLSHVWLSGVNNRFGWDVAVAKEIFDFGKWVFLSSIVGFLLLNEDRFIMGWLLSATYMGLYSIASLLSIALRELVNKVTSAVVTPALGEINRERPEKVWSLYYKIRFPIDALCLVSMGFLFIGGESVVKILYDHRYAEAGKMLEILSLTLFVTRYATVGSLSVALGKPQVMPPLQIFRVICLTLFVPLGFSLFGLLGAIWGVPMASLAEVPPLLWLQKRWGILSIKKELLALAWIPLGMALGAFLNVLVLYSHFHIR